MAQGLQNETLEPPKFIKNSDLDPPECQEVAPEGVSAYAANFHPGGAGAPNFIKNGVGTQLCKHMRKSWSQSGPSEAKDLQNTPNLRAKIDVV